MKGLSTMMTTETDINEALGLAPGKNRMKKYLYWAVALVLVLSVLGFWIGKQRAAAANTGMRYRTEAARTGDLNVTVTATGQLKPTHTVDVGSQVYGIVLSRGVEPGQTIAASFQVATLFEIAEDLRKMRLEVNIDEADVGQVKEGQKVRFTVDAYPGRQFPGTITRLRYSSTTSNNVVTYLAEISVENDQLLLRPGM